MNPSKCWCCGEAFTPPQALMPTPGACASCEQLLEDDSPFQAAGLACLPLGASPVPAGKPLSLEDIPVAA